MKEYAIQMLFALLFFHAGIAGLPEKIPVWTWLHRKHFTQDERARNTEKKEILFSKIDVPHFTQLIFSWNAFRPAKGHFTFYAQVRDCQKKKWSKWHKMMDWGNKVQTSYKSVDNFSQYHHVRLEILHSICSDAFRIKIVAQENADMSLLNSFTVNVSDFTKFVSESAFCKEFTLPSIVVNGAPQISQFKLLHPRNDGLCSPTSCVMLTSFLIAKTLNPIDFAERSLDKGLDKYGSWPFNLAHAFECANGRVSFAVMRCNSFKNLHDQLVKGIPVVVSVRGAIEGAPRVYRNGHLLMVIGFDALTQEVICHDPAVSHDEEVKKRYELSSFLHAWEASHRLTYLAEKLSFNAIRKNNEKNMPFI